MEFHISRESRKKYKFEDSLFSYNGNVIFANFHTARVFARRMNEHRDLKAHPETAAKASQVNAMGLMDEIFHHVIHLYRDQKLPSLYQDLETALIKKMGKRSLNKVLYEFLRHFPPPVIFQGKTTATEYLSGETDGMSNRSAALEELFMLWLANRNPAFRPYLELFNDQNLEESAPYAEVIIAIKEFFSNQPTFGPYSQNLVDMLRSPAVAVPDSLKGQLDYIRARWGDMLGHYLLKLLGSLNLISEEERVRGLGPGPVKVPVYAGAGVQEFERFSPDAHWMPRLVLMAKNTYVWLDQLSKRYQQPIRKLDQIPDEELDCLAEWGFTGLWLIGIWERSRASARIKQLCGNPEAIASAYSLKKYHIARDLGGEKALENLRKRCRNRGIRLASDMVPNHMAVDSDWVYEHPDWFISLPYPPFPSYSFNGPNLSDDERGDIFIEDHYYDRTDAAVIFKYHDRITKRDYFIYHGNDGTSMPWNDTAQLNYLNPEVREAVIRTIIDVARRFPIIRFDAAMTLALRHYQRLWYPLPGGGCDIPSRSDFGMLQEQFNRHFPREFWREVVDRIAEEVPDTLLLAEAFWLMEGYFVRTLGMHRVYNSAFMNLLRDESNAKYRQVMKNTLEFDPEILNRFVNFMNNPDEETAANQFGKGDKYFGICTLMATMPGLPMFGHGQVEGLTEKYGMEYKRAYWDEQPDRQLVDRHIGQIFPLLKRRYLFANVDHFYLYDFYNETGMVDENVFAYSNCYGGECSLVVYQNRFADTSGWVRTSASFMDKAVGELRQVDLISGLGLSAQKRSFVIFRDQLTGLEYIRNGHEISKKGLFIQLDAYRAYVFLNFHEVIDGDDGAWKQVHDHLNGRGVSDIHSLRWELPLRPVLQPLREVINPNYLNFLLDHIQKNQGEKIPESLFNEADHKFRSLVHGAASLLDIKPDFEKASGNFRKSLDVLFLFQLLDQLYPGRKTKNIDFLSGWLRETATSEILLGQIIWVFLENMRSGLGMDLDDFMKLLDNWNIISIIETSLWGGESMGISARDAVRFIRILFEIAGWFRSAGRRNLQAIFRDWIAQPMIRDFLQVNEYAGKTWFNKDASENFLNLLASEGISEIGSVYNLSTKRAFERLAKLSDAILFLGKSAERSAYKLEVFLRILKKYKS